MDDNSHAQPAGPEAKRKAAALRKQHSRQNQTDASKVAARVNNATEHQLHRTSQSDASKEAARVNNAAEQRQHRTSQSDASKVAARVNNAAEQRQHRTSQSDASKAAAATRDGKTRQRNAEAQLSAQLQTIAGILTEKADPIHQDKHVYDGFETSPNAALGLLYSNTGLGQHCALRKLCLLQMQHQEPTDNDFKDAEADVLASVVSDETKQRVTEEYLRATNPSAPIYSCAACGIRMPQATYQRSGLSCLNLLVVTESTKATQLAYGPSGRVLSYYDSPATGTRYHLHPEFVDQPGSYNNQEFLEESALLCEPCSKSIKDNKIPSMSIANGLDYGVWARVGLPPLMDLEFLSICRDRTYCLQFNAAGKVAGSGEQLYIRGHSIAFEQNDGPEQVLAEMLPHTDLHSRVSITFVGPRQQQDKILSGALPFGSILRMRFDVIIGYLKHLKILNPYYHDIEIKESESTRNYIHTNFQHAVVSNITTEDDPEVTAINAALQSEDCTGFHQQADADHGDETAGAVDGAPFIMDHVHVAPEVTVPESKDGSIFQLLKDKLNPGQSTDDNAFEQAKEKQSARAQPGVMSSTSESVPQASMQANRTLPTHGTASIAREAIPVNEYVASHCWTRAFPHIFLRGDPKLVGAQFSSHLKAREHVMMQFTTAAASCPRFIFSTFNRMQRHAVNTRLALAVKNNTPAFLKMHTMLNEPTFGAELDKAIEEPEAKTSIALSKRIHNCMSIVSSGVPWSTGSRGSKLGHILAQERDLGIPTTFNTIAPDPTGNTLAMRCHFPSHGNGVFPAIDVNNKFANCVREGKSCQIPTQMVGSNGQVQDTTSTIELTRNDVINIVVNNSIPAALCHRSGVEKVFDIIYGCPIQNLSTRKSVSRMAHLQGLFGHTVGHTSANETNGRGFLHLHSLLYNWLLSWARQTCVRNPRLHTAHARSRDSVVSAEMGMASHVEHLALKVSTIPPTKMSLMTPPNRLTDPDQFQAHYNGCMQQTQVHGHGTRCHAGKTGKEKCAMRMPKEVNTGTMVSVLNEEPDNSVMAQPVKYEHPSPPFSVESKLIVVDTARRAFTHEQVLKLLDPLTQDEIDHLVQTYDSTGPNVEPHPVVRLLQDAYLDHDIKNGIIFTAPGAIGGFIEHTKNKKIQCQKVDSLFARTIYSILPPHMKVHFINAILNRNGTMVEHNDQMLATLGCNIANLPLPSGSAATPVLIYVADYITKNVHPKTALLPLIAAARKKERDFPSVAPNAAEDVNRSTQRTMAALINGESRTQETSLHLAAFALLGGDPEPGSSTSGLLNMGNAISYATTNCRPEHLQQSVYNASINAHVDLSTIAQPHDDRSDEVGAFEDPFGDFQDDRPVINRTSLASTGDEELSNRQRDKVNCVTEGNVASVSIGGQIIPHDTIGAYAYRPKDFNDYSLEDFFNATMLHKKPAPEGLTRGRRANGSYPIGDGAGLIGLNIKIRSKQITPKLFPPPPRCPLGTLDAGSTDAWKNAAHGFAQYALLLHRPWNTDTHLPGVLNWNALLEHTTKLVHSSEDSFIMFCRLQKIITLVQGLSIPNASKIMQIRHDAREAHVWKNSPTSEMKLLASARRSYDSGVAAPTDEQRAIIDAIADQQRGGEVRPGGKGPSEAVLRARREQGQLASTVGVLWKQNIQTERYVSPADVVSTEPNSRIDSIDLKRPQPSPTDVVRSTLSSPSYTRSAVIDRNEACWVRLHPIAKQLNDSQWDAYTIVLKELDKSASERRGILIHGGPGAGKSFIISAISEELVLRGKEIIKAAFVSNQANAIGGLTLHNVTGINPKSSQKTIDQLSSVKLQELRDSHTWDSVEVFLVDEISSVPAFLLAYADDRMKTLKKCTTRPFGGLVPVYVGDFFQLPPPSSSSVAQTLVDSACSKGVTLNPNENTAVEQFKTFRRIDIEGNERGTDPLYKTLIQSARDTTIGHRPFEQLRAHMDSMTLKDGDASNDSSSAINYDEAPILVGTNRLCHSLIQERAGALANALGTVHLTWKLPITGTWAENATKEQVDILYATEPELWDHFIQNAPSVLTTAVNTDRALCNGSTVRLHSINLTGKDEQMIQVHKVGTTIIVEPPLSVNVELIGESLKTHRDISINSPNDPDTAKPIIALKAKKSDKALKLYLGLAEVNVRTIVFPVDMFLSCTYYKVQGATMNAVVMDINKWGIPPHLSFEAFYVGISRVRELNGIKFLPLLPGQTYEHIFNLQLDPRTQAYLLATEDGKPFNEDIAKTSIAERDQLDAEDKAKAKVKPKSKAKVKPKSKVMFKVMSKAHPNAEDTAVANGIASLLCRPPYDGTNMTSSITTAQSNLNTNCSSSSSASTHGAQPELTGDKRHRAVNEVGTPLYATPPPKKRPKFEDFASFGCSAAEHTSKWQTSSAEDGAAASHSLFSMDIDMSASAQQHELKGRELPAEDMLITPTQERQISTRKSSKAVDEQDTGQEVEHEMEVEEVGGVQSMEVEDPSLRSNAKQAAADSTSSTPQAQVDRRFMAEDSLRDLMQEVLRDPQDEEVIVTAFDIPVTRRIFHCLKPNTWLNDEIINYYMCLLKKRNTELVAHYNNSGTRPDFRPSYFFNSFFVNKLLDNETKSYMFSNVKRWSKNFNTFEMDKIFCPVNINNSHWTLAVMYISECRITYYDSMGGQGKHYVDGLFQYLKDEHRDKKKTELPNAKSWKLEYGSPNGCPQQIGTTDCGVFVIAAADHLSEDLPLNYTQEEITDYWRTKIGASVLRKKLNYNM